MILGPAVLTETAGGNSSVAFEEGVREAQALVIGQGPPRVPGFRQPHIWVIGGYVDLEF